jgi:hypothetical protein
MPPASDLFPATPFKTDIAVCLRRQPLTNLRATIPSKPQQPNNNNNNNNN